MSEEVIKSFLPMIDSADISAVSNSLELEWGPDRNKSIHLLQESIRKCVKKTYCLPVSHGTAAITIALASLDLKAGDEILMPNLTWVACAAPIVQLGLTPVFLNVDDTLCLDPTELQRSINCKTKVIFAIDLAGSLPNWAEIKKIATDNSIIVLEDAAESIGGEYESKPAGSFGDISILSFSPTKLITGGQGGAICTNDEVLYERFKSLFHHGINQTKTGKYFWSDEIGYNFQITNFQAALINSQLTRLPSIIEVKKSYYDYYLKFLSLSKFVYLYKFKTNIQSNYWLYIILPKKKFEVPKEFVLIEALKLGLELRPFFYLLSDMPVYSGYYHAENDFNRHLADFGICLPYGFDLSEEKILKICEIIELVYSKLSHA